MTDIVEVVIGGETYSLPLIMTFAQLERVNPAMRAFAKATAEDDGIAQTSALLAIVANLLNKPGVNVVTLKDSLRVGVAGDERAALLENVLTMMKASGFVKETGTGEAEPGTDPAS